MHKSEVDNASPHLPSVRFGQQGRLPLLGVHISHLDHDVVSASRRGTRILPNRLILFRPLIATS